VIFEVLSIELLSHLITLDVLLAANGTCTVVLLTGHEGRKARQ